MLRELTIKQVKVAWASEAGEVAEVEEVEEVRDLQLLHVDLAARGAIKMRVQTQKKVGP